MATWKEFAEARPDMARVLDVVQEPGPIMYLATVRKSGAPRVHPVCPVFADGRVFVAVAETSPKRFDLANDGRYALHGTPGPWRDGIGDDELYITGRARRVEGEDVRRLVSTAAGHAIHPSDRLFELDIDYVMTAVWHRVGQPDTYAERQHWRAG